MNTMTPARKTALLVASIGLAERATSYTATSRLQHNISEGQKLFQRAVRAQNAAFRLQRVALSK